MEGGPLSERTNDHVAFKIPDDEFTAYEARIRSVGLHISEPRQITSGEGRSLCFYESDNHLFELHTGTLAERLDEYRRLF